MNRITLLDGLRGFLIVFMLMNHVTFSGGFALGWLNYSHLTFLQSAQGFIFLSGLLVGLVYMRIYDQRGPWIATRRLGQRAVELYCWHLSLVLIVLVLSRLIAGSWTPWGDWLGHLFEDGTAYAVAAAGLLYQPSFMDILPQYIVYLLVSPAVLWLVATGRLWLVAAVSLNAWLVIQLGAHLPLVARFEAALWYGQTDLVLRAAFNPVAWQILFVPGVAIGALMARGELVAGRLFAPGSTGLLRLAMSVLLFFLAWRVALLAGWVDTPVLQRFQTLERRGEFGPIFLINFLAAGYAVAWLLLAGPSARSPIIRRSASLLHGMLRHPFIMLLGRHALPVYAFHVLLVYGLRMVDWQLDGLGDPWSSLLGLLSIVALALPALAAKYLQPSKTSSAATIG